MFDSALEEYLEIPSDRCPFEQRPWMKAAQTADALIEAVEGGKFLFIRSNFAGGDMVGHTGRLQPTIVALESIDLSLARVAAAVERARGCLVITADHGNAEDMVERDKTGTPLLDAEGRPRRRTAHSLNPVPFAVMDYSKRRFRMREIPDAGLGNIAATLAELLGYAPPADFDPSLVEAV
jgi:2,3-bisphosphoglycerate-independent phosphoglycerate mutase